MIGLGGVPEVGVTRLGQHAGVVAGCHDTTVIYEDNLVDAGDHLGAMRDQQDGSSLNEC